MLARYRGLHRLPTRRDGGLIHLVAGVVAENPARRLDAIVYLLLPDDPTSVFPEGQALKRECVIHEVPFVSTPGHAREWFELTRLARNLPRDPALDPWFDYSRQTVALVAHVARQHEADIHLLERSARIVTERSMCVSDRASAESWVKRCVEHR